MADINLNIHNDMPLAGWENDKQPAINALHLNDIENAIFNALKASQYISEHSSDLNDLINISGELEDLGKIDDALSTDKTIQTLTDDDKIVLEQLKDLLEKISYDYSTPGSPMVTVDTQTMATREWAVQNFGQYIYSNQKAVGISDTYKHTGDYICPVDGQGNPVGISCAKIIININGYTSPAGIDDLKIYTGQTSSDYIRFVSSDIDFFDHDAFGKVVIELKQALTDPAQIIGTISGYNSKGYNYRSIDFTVNQSLSLLQMCWIKGDIGGGATGNITDCTVNILYGTPAPTNQIIYADFADIPASDIQ